MRDVNLLYLELDNVPCVEDALAGQLDKALERFKPDQLGVARVTQVFEDIDPVHLNMQWIRFNTYEPYRREYPGRALLACDGLQATKYPPDPININNAFFNHLEDVHNQEDNMFVTPFVNPEGKEGSRPCFYGKSSHENFRNTGYRPLSYWI